MNNMSPDNIANYLLMSVVCTYICSMVYGYMSENKPKIFEENEMLKISLDIEEKSADNLRRENNMLYNICEKQEKIINTIIFEERYLVRKMFDNVLKELKSKN